MMQTSLSERVDYLKRVIAASRERQRSNYALKNSYCSQLAKKHYQSQANVLGDVIRKAELDILKLKQAN